MTDLIVVPQTNQWQKLKALVLDSVSSPITKRVYNLGLDEFFAWHGQEPRSINDDGPRHGDRETRARSASRSQPRAGWTHKERAREAGSHGVYLI
jgi:hypothetical protein